MTIQRITLDLDNDEELLNRAIDMVKEASQGRIAVTHVGSPIYGILSGLTFLLAEFRWFLNLLPEALVVEFFRNTGLVRSEGTFATGEVVIQLDRVLSSPYTLPLGTEILSGYLLSEDFILPSGNNLGRCKIIAEAVGDEYNRDAYGLFGRPNFPYISSVWNERAILGGDDIESTDDYITRSQAVLRSRETLITLDDYDTYLQSKGIMGYIYPNTNKALNFEPGSVLIHVINLTGTETTDIPTLLSSVEAKSPLGTNTTINNVPLTYQSVDIICSVESASEGILDAIEGNIVSSLLPQKVKPGNGLSIPDLSYVARSAPGVNRVISVLVNNLSVETQPSTKYILARLGDLSITIQDTLANTLTRVTSYAPNDDSDSDGL